MYLTMPLNVEDIRKDFPIFQRETKPGTPLVYLDSTATSQKPLAVIEAMNQFYRRSNANIIVEFILLQRKLLQCMSRRV